MKQIKIQNSTQIISILLQKIFISWNQIKQLILINKGSRLSRQITSGLGIFSF